MTFTVLHVSQPTDGGVARVAADLAEDQVRRGWRVLVASPAAGPLGGWARRAGATHVPWEARRDPIISAPRESRRLGGLVLSVAPDLVHLHSSKAGLAGRLAIRGALCTVFQPHAWSFDAVRGPLRTAAVVWERLGARWADVVLCVSDAERARGEAAGVRGRYRVIPNGLDLQALPAAGPNDRATARDRLGLGPGPVAVCVGRLSRQKGQDVALEAWPAVRSILPDARLVLVGEGPARGALQRRAGPGVYLVGMRTDVPDWLAAADVVIAPSRWEGMSLSVLEAMAAGRSVVAADVPGMGELLGSDVGAVVPVGDAGALAAAVVTRLRDHGLVEEEGRAGRRRAEREHPLDRTTGAVAGLYEELLEDRRRIDQARGL